MFFIKTRVGDQCQQPYKDLLCAIDKKIAQYSQYQLDNMRFGFTTPVDYEAYEDLVIYKQILLNKIFCSDCLCDWDINCIISQIRNLTNTIC